jgi:hypothetical protein
MTVAKDRAAELAEKIRDISLQVYRMSLDHPSGGGKGSADRQVAEDKDGGIKQRNRAGAYDKLTKFYIEVLEHQFDE